MGCNQSKQEFSVDSFRASADRIWNRREPIVHGQVTKKVKDAGITTTSPESFPEQQTENDSKAGTSGQVASRSLGITAASETSREDDYDYYYGGETKEEHPEDSLPDPRLQILTYFNTVSDLNRDSMAESTTSSLPVSIEEEPLAPQPQEPSDQPAQPESPPMFTVWRPTSAEAIRKMVDGEGVGKGLDIKGKSSKAGCLSGFVPYLQIHEEEHKSKVKTIDRGGRTRIFFASEQVRDQVLEDLGPLQNHMFNAVQDAKRTVKKSIKQVLYVPHHAKKKVKKVGKAARKSAVRGGSMVAGAATTVGSRVGSSFVSAGSEMFQTGSDLFSSTSEQFTHAGNSVLNFSRRASTGASSVSSSVSSTAGDVVNKVITRSPIGEVRRVTMSGAVTISTGLSNISNPLASGVIKGVTTVGGGVVKGVTTVGGGVVKGVTTVGGGVAKGVTTVGGGVVKGVTTVGGGVAKGVTTVGGGVVKGVTTVRGGVVKGVTTVGGGVVKGVTTVGGGVAKGVTTVGGGVAKGVTTVGGGVAKGVTTVGGGVAKGVTTVGARASTISMEVAGTAMSAVGINEEDDVDFALKRLLWDMDDPSIRKIDKYAPQCYGIELPDRLLWQAFVTDSDISRPEGSKWYTARASQPAFQDMNLIAISKSRKKKKKNKKKGFKKSVHKDPLVVLWQTCTGNGEDDNPMDPRGLVMAYEENGRVKPVVSDFDCFIMGSTQIRYDVLPEEQVKLLDWCISNIEDVLEKQKSSRELTWTDRWLHVLKSSTSKGFHPEIPKYGFGDATSIGIVENAVDYLQGSGAVRHGAECFNFYFPQDLDDEFLIVSESLQEEPKWRYVNPDELLDFLFERVKEGYTFPLNPKWVLCDDSRWKELYDCLRTSESPLVQESLDAWVPKTVRDKIESIRERHPEGFVSDKERDEEVCGTEAMDLAMLDLDRLIIFRRARFKLHLMGIFLTLLKNVRKRRRDLELESMSDIDISNGEIEEDEEDLSQSIREIEIPEEAGLNGQVLELGNGAKGPRSYRTKRTISNLSIGELDTHEEEEGAEELPGGDAAERSNHSGRELDTHKEEISEELRAAHAEVPSNSIPSSEINVPNGENRVSGLTSEVDRGTEEVSERAEEQPNTELDISNSEIDVPNRETRISGISAEEEIPEEAEVPERTDAESNSETDLSNIETDDAFNAEAEEVVDEIEHDDAIERIDSHHTLDA